MASESRAVRASSHRRVEGEHLGLKLTKGNAVLLACVFLRELKLLTLRISRHRYDYKVSVRKVKCALDRVCKTGSDPLLHHKSVYHDLNAMLFIFIKLDGFGQIVKASVNADSDVSALSRVLKNLFVHSLFGSDHGGKHHKSLSVGQGQYSLNYLIDRLLLYRLAADRAMRNADARVKQTEIIVYLGYSSDRRARVS